MNKSANYPSLQEQTVFITGGATGIGATMVTAFCQQGARVAFVDIDDVAAQKLIAQISDANIPAPWFRQVDVTDIDQLQSAIADASEELGQIHSLINNVANDSRHDPMQMNETAWRKCMAVNLDASFFASQAAAKIMRSQQRGSIVNLSSINAILGPANMTGYVTAKAGINGMTKALAKDLGNSNIRVNAILPGWVVTDRQLNTWLTEDAEREWSRQVALSQRITPDDVANLALFLAADESRMITGQCLTIDAGRT
ncbi:MAG: SDR family NAD(P)-dependent oxidoreductase [Pseudomonadota bacterium]